MRLVFCDGWSYQSATDCAGGGGVVLKNAILNPICPCRGLRQSETASSVKLTDLTLHRSS